LLPRKAINKDSVVFKVALRSSRIVSDIPAELKARVGLLAVFWKYSCVFRKVRGAARDERKFFA
jgi:hypothetical protein